MHQEWYQNFVSEENLDRELLFELMAAANYLGIQPLLQLILLKITFELNGRNEQQVSLITCLTALRSLFFCFRLNTLFRCLGPWLSRAATAGGGGCGVSIDANPPLFQSMAIPIWNPDIRTRLIRVARCHLSIDCDMSQRYRNSP